MDIKNVEILQKVLSKVSTKESSCSPIYYFVLILNKIKTNHNSILLLWMKSSFPLHHTSFNYLTSTVRSQQNLCELMTSISTLNLQNYLNIKLLNFIKYLINF